jgi:hypothetical protein
MIKKHTLTKDQVLYAIQNSEFDNEVLSSEDKVVIVMTQDWCPQWHNMNNWIYSLEVEEDIGIYEFIYNKSDYFNEFMLHKESVWKNRDIPYLRYYKASKLINDTNYKNQKAFLEILNM